MTHIIVPCVHIYGFGLANNDNTCYVIVPTDTESFYDSAGNCATLSVKGD